ncbi:hypothetical protein OtV6_210 [Ostreococcus tauri virus RT-2011]|nr:hypothetical protein OtV6_210 [Ostreococcus tauri virus RT-2011]
MSTTMNSTTIFEYIQNLEKLNDESRIKIEQLKELYRKSEEERVATLEKLNSKLLDDEIQRVGAVLNGSDSESVASNEYLYDTVTDSDSDDEYFVAYNNDLVEAFESLCYYETDEFKKKAYDDAAYAISNLPFKVTDGHELAKGPQKVPGIGKGIADKINEFLDTGKINKLEKLKRAAAVDETHDDYFVDELNTPLVHHIEKLARGEEDHFKFMAYKKAANAIKSLNFKVTNGEELAKGPKKVPGIGKSIARKIDDFLTPPKKVSFELESNPVSTNEEIAWHLDVLASLEAEEHGSQDPHKIRAYRNAAEAIRDIDFEVTNGTEISQGPKKVKGIGKSIARKIDELIVTGKIQRIRDLSE